MSPGLTWTPQQLSRPGETRDDIAVLEVGPWEVFLGVGFDYIYPYAEMLDATHDEVRQGALLDRIRAIFGEDGVGFTLRCIEQAERTFASVHREDVRLAKRWAELPTEDPEGWERVEELDYTAHVEAGGAVFQPWTQETRRARLTLADRDIALPATQSYAAVAREQALWILGGRRLLVAHAGRIPSWVDRQGEDWGVSGTVYFRQLWVRGDEVGGAVGTSLPTVSRLGAVLRGIHRVRIDPERGPVATS